MAGLEITPGAVVASLEAMNTNLNKIIDDAQNMMYKIDELEYTKDVLVGESYDSIRNYYSDMHTSVMRATILFAEAMIQENNTYKGCVSGYLSGIGYVNEGALIKEKLELMEQIQWAYRLAYASKCGGYSSWIGSMEHALRLVEKKLDQIDAFKAATAGLYQGISAYGEAMRMGIESLHCSVFDGNTIFYSVDYIDRGWKDDVDKLWDVRTEAMFVNNMVVHFGFDQNTSKILYKLYMEMYRQDVNNINQEYFALLASCVYAVDVDSQNNHNELWQYLAGTGDTKEIEIKMEEYGLSEDEIKYLTDDIKRNYDASSLNMNDISIKLNKPTITEEEKEAILREFEWQERYIGKVDMAHMSITIATILNPDDSFVEKIGFGSGIFNGIYDLNANAGYVGDVYGTAGNGPKLTPDDYQADLDAVNLSVRLKDGKNAIEVLNEYYAGINSGEINRAIEFVTNIGDGDREQGIEKLNQQAQINRVHIVGTHTLYRGVAPQDYGGLYQTTVNDMKKAAVVIERQKIVYNFLESINNSQNYYVEYVPVNEDFAEKGEVSSE